MSKRREVLTWRDVLRYGKWSRATVRRFYARYRDEQKIPLRCDNDKCRFHTEKLEWNGQPLPLILDHKNGVNRDNRPENLNYLCPNCDALLPTRGGGNKGRVSMSSGGFSTRRPDGKRDYTLPAEPGHFRLTGGEVHFTVRGERR